MSGQQTPTIDVYTLPGCRYCTRARALLSERGLGYSEIDVRGLPGGRRWLVERMGRGTVPQIVINGLPVGGSDDLARLARLGVLDALAAGTEFPIMYEQRYCTPKTIVRSLVARLRRQPRCPAVYHVQVWLDQAGRVVQADRH